MNPGMLELIARNAGRHRHPAALTAELIRTVRAALES
jgi:hypothetical protein